VGAQVRRDVEQARLGPSPQERQTYTKANTNGALPDDDVRALAAGPDGSLWAGTAGGLARLDKDGRWQTYNRANTNGALPNDNVRALTAGPDGCV
jgi:ligand-binding sensor domain-containing protein